jgi:hypothetical protein
MRNGLFWLHLPTGHPTRRRPLPAQFYSRAIKAFIQTRFHGLFQMQAVGLSHSGGTAGKRQCSFRPVVCRCGNRKRIEYPRHVRLVGLGQNLANASKVNVVCHPRNAVLAATTGMSFKVTRFAKAYMRARMRENAWF